MARGIKVAEVHPAPRATEALETDGAGKGFACDLELGRGPHRAQGRDARLTEVEEFGSRPVIGAPPRGPISTLMDWDYPGMAQQNAKVYLAQD